MDKKIRGFAALLAGLIFTLFLSSAQAFADTCDPIREEVLRLHILADSDSEEDQRVKIAVRDKLLSLHLFDTDGVNSRLEAERAAQENLVKIKAAAQQEVYAQGHTDQVEAEIVRMYFSTRVYDTVTLPAGYYDAVRITIGSGEGHNWWCVLYPQLCIPAASEEEDTLSDVLTEEEEEIVTEDGYEVKFFLVELYESVCRFLFGE